MKRLTTYINEDFDVLYNGIISESRNDLLKIPEYKITPTKEQLRKFVEITAQKFLSKEAKEVIDAMLKGEEIFTSAGKVKDDIPQNYVKDIVFLIKQKCCKQIPVFLTEQEFSDVLEKKRPLDFFVWDLKSEKGRAYIYERFKLLAKKYAMTYSPKLGFDDLELEGAAIEGLVDAMNNYGKNRNEYVRTKEEQERFDARNDKKEYEEKEYEIRTQTNFAGYVSSRMIQKIYDFARKHGAHKLPKSDFDDVDDKDKDKYYKMIYGDAQYGSEKDDGTIENVWSRLDSELLGVQDNGGGVDPLDKLPELDRDAVLQLRRQIVGRLREAFPRAKKDYVDLFLKRKGLKGEEEKEKTENAFTGTDNYWMTKILKFMKTDDYIKQCLKKIKRLAYDS